MKYFKIIFFLIWVNFSVSYGADLQKGLDAARSGDFSTALKEWRPLAENGEVIPQYMLGQMYIYGHGVSQDTNEAMRYIFTKYSWLYLY